MPKLWIESIHTNYDLNARWRKIVIDCGSRYKIRLFSIFFFAFQPGYANGGKQRHRSCVNRAALSTLVPVWCIYTYVCITVRVPILRWIFSWWLLTRGYTAFRDFSLASSLRSFSVPRAAFRRMQQPQKKRRTRVSFDMCKPNVLRDVHFFFLLFFTFAPFPEWWETVKYLHISCVRCVCACMWQDTFFYYYVHLKCCVSAWNLITHKHTHSLQLMFYAGLCVQT